MRIINANVVRGHLSENYLTRKFIARNIRDLRYMTCYVLQAGGSLHLPPAVPNPPLLPSHSYISAHMHAIRCCKQDCERADLAHMKSSKERVKGTDYVNSIGLTLQLYSTICGTRTLISACLGHEI